MPSGTGAASCSSWRHRWVSILVLVKYALGVARCACGQQTRLAGLNSCSGEVCPRGARLRHAAARTRTDVSILVLVKYALGAPSHDVDVDRRIHCRLNSCSGEVCPRGRRVGRARRGHERRGLNSCSGEVCPRGQCPHGPRWTGASTTVSILVLVKYALGGRTSSRSADVTTSDVSILVLVKYALGADRARCDRAAALHRGLNSCSGEVCPRGRGAPGPPRRPPVRSQFLFW